MAFAGWIGFAFTFVNLLPCGQLDGGHIMTAMFGARANLITTAAVLIGALVMAVWSLTWCVIFFGLVLSLGVAAPDREQDEPQPFTAHDRALCGLAIAALILTASTLR